MFEDVPWVQLYYAEAENNCSEVSVEVSGKPCVLCALNLSSGWLEDEVNQSDSVSQPSQSTSLRQQLHPVHSKKAAARKAAIIARSKVLNDGLEQLSGRHIH